MIENDIPISAKEKKNIAVKIAGRFRENTAAFVMNWPDEEAMINIAVFGTIRKLLRKTFDSQVEKA